jgi:ATP-binding cassette subfamily F protein uup
MATLDQKRASLDPKTTLKDALTGGGSDFVEVNGERKHVMGYMKDFLFNPEQARTPIGRLSGGERGRLMLARALAQPSNLLVLDEPTNDLDLETLDLLQEMLTDYPGTLILVSHDRDFLDRVASNVLVAEGEGQWQDYAGGYTDMVAQRGEGVRGRAIIEPIREAKTSNAAAAAAKAPSREKMSFKDKHALETLPKTIAALDGKKAKLRTILEDPQLYAKDPAAFARIEAEMAQAEDAWLALEMRREAVEG